MNEKNLKEIYRPISLLLVFGKILEKLIFDTLYQHLESNSLLNPNQSVFRPGDSTVNQLLSMVNSISQAFDCSPPLDVALYILIYQRLLTELCHDGLSYKLRSNGISGRLLLLKESFLAIRKQRTVLNGKFSKWGSITAGIPRGLNFGTPFLLNSH